MAGRGWLPVRGRSRADHVPGLCGGLACLCPDGRASWTVWLTLAKLAWCDRVTPKWVALHAQNGTSLHALWLLDRLTRLVHLKDARAWNLPTSHLLNKS